MRFLELVMAALVCAMLIPLGLALVACVFVTLAAFLACAMLGSICMGGLGIFMKLTGRSPARRR